MTPSSSSSPSSAEASAAACATAASLAGPESTGTRIRWEEAAIGL